MQVIVLNLGKYSDQNLKIVLTLIRKLSFIMSPYEQKRTASEIVRIVGGFANVYSLAHNLTAIIIQVQDVCKIAEPSVFKCDCISDVLINESTAQFLIGHHVPEVFEIVLSFEKT